MKILHLSDTHGLHEGQCERWVKELIEEYQPNVIVHSGDFMRHSMKFQDIQDFFEWFLPLPVEHKILVPGNHDKWCEQLERNEYLRHATVPDDLTLLINESLEIDGIKIWGSPYTPEFYDWGFQLNEREAESLWPTIPDDTELVITHGPAHEVLDDMYAQDEADKRTSALGCPYLTKRLKELKHLKGHLFGHIHGGYGRDESHGYIALNSAILNENYRPTNKPQILEL